MPRLSTIRMPFEESRNETKRFSDSYPKAMVVVRQEPSLGTILGVRNVISGDGPLSVTRQTRHDDFHPDI